MSHLRTQANLRGHMNKLVFGVAVCQLVAAAASAAEPLSDGQLDRITAGALAPIMIDCPGCVSTSSGQTSTTTNGSTVVVTSTGNTGSTASTGGTGNTGGVPRNAAEELLAAQGGLNTNISQVPFPANFATAITAQLSFNPMQP